MADFWIANTISDLIQGDVLGLGTTTSIDNGELTFLQDADGVATTIWKCQASDGGIRALRPGDGSSHFPYVCFSADATAVRTPVDLACLGEVRGRPLQELVAEAIAQLRQQGRLAEAPIYGLRLVSQWQSLVITVASKLCMGQQRRNTAVASSAASDGTAARSIYQLLQHYRLTPEDPGDPSDPIRFLGRSLEWDCCGFFDTDPAHGRVTIPDPHAHLHLHGCSTDLRFGGHLHYEHPGTRLASLHQLVSDLAIEALHFRDGSAHFTVANRGAMDVSDVGVAVVVNDRYSGHRYLRLPWLAAGASETFSVPLQLPAGGHRLEVIADPQGQILEEAAFQLNNRATLDIQLPDG